MDDFLSELDNELDSMTKTNKVEALTTKSKNNKQEDKKNEQKNY